MNAITSKTSSLFALLAAVAMLALGSGCAEGGACAEDESCEEDCEETGCDDEDSDAIAAEDADDADDADADLDFVAVGDELAVRRVRRELTDPMQRDLTDYVVLSELDRDELVAMPKLEHRAPNRASEGAYDVEPAAERNHAEDLELVARHETRELESTASRCPLGICRKPLRVAVPR